MADIIYNTFKEYVGDNTIDMDNDTFKIALMAATYTPDATHSTWSDVSAYEISGTGYSAGGATLSGVTWTRTTGTVKFDATDASWSSATFTARYAIIYSDTPTSPADPLVCMLDFSTSQSVVSGTFTVVFNASGILTLA